MPQYDKLLSLENAASHLGCETKFLKNSALGGEIPFSSIGERMMFDIAVLDDWYSNLLLHHPKTHRVQLESIDISTLCNKQAISLSLPGKTKTAILKNLAILCEKTGLLYDTEEFYQELRQREETSSTAMSMGIALVHTRNHDEYLCEAPFIAIARSEQPVFFGDINGTPTDIFFVCAAQDSNTHIRILAQICRAILETSLLQDIRNAETADDIVNAMISASKKIK